MKGNAVVVMGVDRHEVRRDNGTHRAPKRGVFSQGRQRSSRGSLRWDAPSTPHLLLYRSAVSRGKEKRGVGEKATGRAVGGQAPQEALKKRVEVTLPNGRIATYEVIGSGGEPLLTFVGGPGLSAKLMRADAELFAERFTCYLIDPHGSGGSTPPQDETAYDFVGHARFYEEVHRALGLGSVSVHGVSFGGSVALTYTALFPEVTTRCIAVSAFAVGEELDEEEGGDAAAEMEAALARHAHAEWYSEAREIWDDWTARALAATDPGEIRDMLARVFPLYPAYPDRPDVRKAIDEAREMLEVDLRAVKVWEGGLYQRGDLRPLLGQIQCPTLIVCGALDLIGSPAQPNQIAPRVADAELLILPKCGHMPALERPQPYRDAVLNWCRAHPARP
jgi:pimeloyl-ACP methyl ester carboxylesterase